MLASNERTRARSCVLYHVKKQRELDAPYASVSWMVEAEIKINIRCGLSGIPGWYNIDNSPTIPFSRIPFARRLLKFADWPVDIRRHDVRKGVPYATNGVRHICSSHTFEHFTWAESVNRSG